MLEEITADTESAGRMVRASMDDPQYRVRSEESGGEAVHEPSAPKKKGATTTAMRCAARTAAHDPCKR